MNDIVSILIRTVFFYFFVVFVYRLMGKREVGELAVVDLIVSVLIAELVAISIENHDDTIFLTIVPIMALVLLEITLGWISLKSKTIRTLLGGKPSLIINKGKINYKEMVKQRYTVDDLLFELRQREIKCLNEVDYALLETNGKLSIFKKRICNRDYPMPIIVDGDVIEDSLYNIGKNRVWLKYMVNRCNMDIKDIFYAFYRDKRLYIVNRDNSTIYL